MFNEKPPILSGQTTKDLVAIRDYLFRMANGLNDIATTANVAVSYGQNGKALYATEKDTQAAVEEARKRARELRDLIIKTAYDITEYVDKKTEEYNSLYVAQSEFGTFQEVINTTIETTARGVVESYDYSSAIESVQDSVQLMQSYFTDINGEIRRGVVLDPDTGEYVIGIAISQSLRFLGELSPGAQAAVPDDGYTYYELNSGQTFGLYTSTGWQFWIDGYKRGWFNSQDGNLHVYFVVAENGVQIGDAWQMLSTADGSVFEIKYVG